MTAPSPHAAQMANQPAKTLRALVLTGFAWSLTTGVVVQVSRVIFAIALARFLTPGEYGVAAMALAISALMFVFTDLSLGVGLVQRSKLTEADRSTVFWTSTGVGGFLTLVGIALSGPLASFYGEPEVQPLFAVLAFTFFVGSLGSTHAALLHREMNFRAISVRVSAASLTGGIFGVLLAAWGFGAWALIGQQLCFAVVSTVLLWLSMPWRPHFIFSAGSLRELGSFGARIFGMRLADYARSNGDRLVIGRFLGSIPLGTYSIAFNIVLSPVSRLLIAITDTLFPALSRLQDDPGRLGSTWLRVNRLVAAGFAPALLGLAVVAPDFVTVVLGPRWGDVAALLQIMAIGVLAHAVSSTGSELLKALGRASTLMWFTVGETVALLAAILVGLQWGLVGIAAAYTIVIVPSRAYLVWRASRAVALPLSRFLVSLGGVAQASLALVAATSVARTTLLQTAEPWLRLIAVILVGIAVYIPACFWRVPELRNEVVLIATVFKRRRQDTSVQVTAEHPPKLSSGLLR